MDRQLISDLGPEGASATVTPRLATDILSQPPSLFSQLRALGKMAQKEWIIFRRYPSWVIALFIWPLLFPIGFIFTARALSGPDQAALPTFAAYAGTTNYMGFIVIGTTLFMWLNITLWDIGFHLRSEQMRGTLESNWLCPVWRFGLLLGPSLAKLGVSVFFLVIGLAQFQIIFGIQLLQGNPLWVLLLLLLTMPSVYGIGMAFGSLVIRFKEANTLVFLVRGIFMVFCGISYPLAVLPAWMQTIAAYLPLTYAVQGIREVALNGAGIAQIMPEIRALILFGALFPVAGYLLFIQMERRARRNGTLGQY